MAVQLEVEFLDRLSEPVRDKKAKSVSAIIRTALERYDFTNMVVMRTAQVMISVRLPVELRRNLKKIARAKHTSIGQLVRSAVEAYLPQLETETAGQLEMPIVAAASAEPPPPDTGKKTRSSSVKRRQRAKAAPAKTKPAARQAKAKPVSKREAPARPLMTKKRKG